VHVPPLMQIDRERVLKQSNNNVYVHNKTDMENWWLRVTVSIEKFYFFFIINIPHLLLGRHLLKVDKKKKLDTTSIIFRAKK
jgi:hypothetical protein